MDNNKTLLTIIAVGVIAIATPIVVVSIGIALAVFWEAVDRNGIATRNQQETVMFEGMMMVAAFVVAAVAVWLKRLLSK